MTRFSLFQWGPFVLGLLLATSAAAQSPAPAAAPARSRLLPAQAYPALLGARIGYGSFRLSGTEVDFQTDPAGAAAHNEPLAALTLGLVVRARLAGPLAFQTELDYVRKGGQLTSPAHAPNTSFAIDYLQIPALLHLALLRAGHLTLAAEAGYAANLSMGGPVIDYRAYPPGTDLTVRGLVFAPVLGAEVSWQQQNHHYLLHARYSRDQTDFYRRTFDGQTYTLRNQGFTLTAGMLLGFDK